MWWKIVRIVLFGRFLFIKNFNELSLRFEWIRCDLCGFKDFNCSCISSLACTAVHSCFINSYIFPIWHHCRAKQSNRNETETKFCVLEFLMLCNWGRAINFIWAPTTNAMNSAMIMTMLMRRLRKEFMNVERRGKQNELKDFRLKYQNNVCPYINKQGWQTNIHQQKSKL